MKTKIIFACFASNLAYAQIGINTSRPAVSLDVVAKRADDSTSEGIIAPRLTGDQIKSTDARDTTHQTGTCICNECRKHSNSIVL